MKRAGSQRERDGGNYVPATTDSISQQYRTAFCALKHTRSSYKSAIYMDSGLSFDASSEVYGGEDLALAVGSGKREGGRLGGVYGEGVKRAGSQRERDGGNSVPATTDSTSQQHRTAFCAFKHTRSSYKPATYMDSGLSFDVSSAVYGGEDLALAVGSGKDRGGSRGGFEGGVKRVGLQREQNGGDFFFATADRIKQQYRTAFCALKHTRSSYKSAIYFVDSGLLFDASSEVYGGEDLALAAGGGRARRKERYILYSWFLIVGNIVSRFHLDVVFFHHVYGF